MSFLTICLNPVLQKTLCFSSVVPGTVNRTGKYRLDVSGKGINVTRVLTQLGKKAVHLTQLGGHSTMRPLFLSLCELDGLSVEWVESESQIRFCYTLLTENNYNITELVEEAEPVGTGTEKLLQEKFDSLLTGQGFSCMIVSGTKAAGFSDAVIPLMVQKVKEKGLKVILDIRGKDLLDSLQFKPDIVKPNLFEFASTFAPDLIRDNDFSFDNPQAGERIKSAMLDLNKKFGSCILLTDGSRKIRVVESYTGYYEMDIPLELQLTNPVNTIGCGDAFTAGLASALEDGANFKEAITEGIRCGALNAGFIKPGVINDE
jgi:1-phosphofructokinase/tagatose 6-phosphate kinase